MILKIDQESSIIDVKNQVDRHTTQSKSCAKKVLLETVALTTTSSEICAIKDFIDRQIDTTISLDSSVLKCLVRHAAWWLTTIHIEEQRHDDSSTYQEEHVQSSDFRVGKNSLQVTQDCGGSHENLVENCLHECWLECNTRTGDHIVSSNAAAMSCRSIRRSSKEERWNRDMMLEILDKRWSLQDGRAEVDSISVASIRYITTRNPEVEAGPTETKIRNEENDGRIYITKKMVSEFGVTMDCKDCLLIGQSHTEKYWVRIITHMENDSAHAKRFEHNLNRQTEFVNPELEDVASSEDRINTSKSARPNEVRPSQEFTITGGVSSSMTGSDVEIRSIQTVKRSLEPDGDDDTICRLDVCDELHEYSSDTCVNDCKGDYTDEVTGVTLLRDDVTRARTEEMTWHEKFKVHGELTDET